MAAETTQRDLEQRALRNVRGLVDRLDAMADVENRRQRHIVIGIATAVLVSVAGLGALAAVQAQREAQAQQRRSCEIAWKTERVLEYRAAVAQGRDPNPGARVSFERWYEGLREPAAAACASS
ncbi:MAG: hypothetical protein ACXWBQ_05505 [Usitatibacter sp.]